MNGNQGIGEVWAAMRGVFEAKRLILRGAEKKGCNFSGFPIFGGDDEVKESTS